MSAARNCAKGDITGLSCKGSFTQLCHVKYTFCIMTGCCFTSSVITLESYEQCVLFTVYYCYYQLLLWLFVYVQLLYAATYFSPWILLHFNNVWCFFILYVSLQRFYFGFFPHSFGVTVNWPVCRPNKICYMISRNMIYLLIMSKTKKSHCPNASSAQVVVF